MAAKKITQFSKSDIIEKYSDYCLMHGHKPASVYKFAKENGFDESVFYQYFASFESLEHHYFVEMFSYTIQSLEQSPSYLSFAGVEKLSAFYFTFFEMATANRSFVMYSLDGGRMDSLKKLKALRKEFLSYAEAILEKPVHVENARAQKIQGEALSEGAWLQFLSIFKFWMEDTSAGFEKTDIFIEKSVKASNDLVYNSPLKSLFDLGKFVWKEKQSV